MSLPRFLLLASAALLAAVSARAMNNADVIKMKKADFSDSTIIQSIAAKPADYDTSTDGLIELKKAGVSEIVIQEIVSAQKSGSGGDKADAAPAVSGPDFSNDNSPSVAPPVVAPVPGKDYFLRSTLHVEKNIYNSTNYARGTVIPVNTPVHFNSVKGDAVYLKRTDTGEEIKVENLPKYTKKSAAEYAGLLLAEQTTPLEKLSAELAASIRAGEMRKGMTKEQVLMARGYPPAHETPSTDGDRWVYWSSRFVKQTIVFANGRLVDGRGIN